LAAGRAGGTWTGFGLVSTAALSDGRTTLGYMDAGDYRAIYGADASFDGQPLPAQAVVVKYTFAGDADFNDKVDFNDFLRLQNAFGQNEQTSAGGDFDFSGTVDFNDFLLLQNSFGQSIAAPAVTPEPAAVAATATIAGVLFNDHDRNGKFDKGDGLSRGVSVWLDLDNDRVHDPNEPTAVTDDKGRFGFKNLAAGKYRVRQVLAKGALESTPARYLTLAKGQAVKGVELGSRTK
ncbi:MAG: sdrD 1, partial [Phycisphaerales bacterium]|nr:sdrD 1 [Phycisphaerales bacterium]